MKIILQYILPVLSVLILTACDSGYEKKGDKVYWIGYDLANGRMEKELPGADVNSFTALREGFFSKSNYFGKDNRHVFYKNRLQTGVEPDGFRKVSEYFYESNNAVYYLDVDHLAPVNGAKPGNLKTYNITSWARTGNTVINETRTVTLKDAEDFVPVNALWGKTSKVLLYKDTVIADGDPATFRVGRFPYEGADKFRKYNLLHYSGRKK